MDKETLFHKSYSTGYCLARYNQELATIIMNGINVGDDHILKKGIKKGLETWERDKRLEELAKQHEKGIDHELGR